MELIEKENKLLGLDEKLKPFKDKLKEYLKEVVDNSIDNIQIQHGD